VTPDIFVYDICLMPFDMIVLHWEYVGLCYPMVSVTCDIWPWVRPSFPFWIDSFLGITVSLWIVLPLYWVFGMTAIGFYSTLWRGSFRYSVLPSLRTHLVGMMFETCSHGQVLELIFPVCCQKGCRLQPC
jgi:hypothetical protein